MNQDFLASHIKRTNRNLLISIVLMIALLIAMISLGGLRAVVQMLEYLKNGDWFYLLLDLGSVVLLLAGLMLSGLALVLTGKLLIRIFKVQHHPIHKAAVIYGQFNDVSYYISSELSHPGTKTYKELIITENWIIKITTFGLNILKIADVVWAYNSVTKHEQGLIGPGVAAAPTEVAKTFSVMIHSKNPILPKLRISRTHELDTVGHSEQNAVEGDRKRNLMLNILEDLEQRHPNAVYEYSRELEELWSKDKMLFIRSAGFTVE
ncbi:hypothetical protein YSY43_08370 [Paenibacillus sp. YSY-4.3]